jgi:hypothetical protein
LALKVPCRNIQTLIVLLLIMLTLIRGSIYAAITIPWWAGHDEEFHFAHIRMLSDRWSGRDSNQGQNWQRELEELSQAARSQDDRAVYRCLAELLPTAQLMPSTPVILPAFPDQDGGLAGQIGVVLEK